MFQSGSASRRLSLAAVFAAIYFVLRSLPNPIPGLFQMIGISGRFTAGDFMLTSMVLILGGWSGALAVVVGTILSYPVNPPLFLGLDFLPGLVNMTVTGLILANRKRIAQAVYVTILLVFLTSPYSLLFGYANIPYAWLHLVALFLLLSPVVERIPIWLGHSDSRQIAGIAILSFVGTMAQHLAGGLLYEFVVGFIQGNSPGVVQQFWRIIFWLYPAERLIVLVVSTLIAATLFSSIRRLSL